MTPKQALTAKPKDGLPWFDETEADVIIEALSLAGYVIVPKEPTDDMANKGESSLICGPLPSDLDSSPSFSWAHAKSCYRAMVSDE